MAAEEILDGSRKDVMNSGAAVRGRRPFEEDVRRAILGDFLRVLKELLAFPS
jgi:hypothetical protein